jgi:glycosyltransferase involved in cell wall biosynthesis
MSTHDPQSASLERSLPLGPSQLCSFSICKLVLLIWAWLKNLWHRISADWWEQLTNNHFVVELVAHFYLVKGMLFSRPDARRLEALLKACRWTKVAFSRRWLRTRLEPFLTGPKTDVSRQERVGWQRYYGSFGRIGIQKALTTSLVLKAPGPDGEKGVLYCSFEYNWMRLLANYDAAAVLKDYYLVGATSGARNDYASMTPFAGLSSDPVFIGVSNLADVVPLQILRPVIEPLPILASDWTNPHEFSPKAHRKRTIDILMIAAWSSLKRHWLLFEALRDMPRNLRVVLVGRNDSVTGRTERDIRDEARAFGVRQELEFHTNLEIDDVYALQCDARISAILTKREGSCVAVSESLFAGSPVAMMEEAYIGSKAYINESTGVLARRRGMAQQLQQFLEESERYKPREWAIENISCFKTSERLNNVLRAWSLKTGRPWTTDIAPLSWRYVPAYARPEDKLRLASAVEELARKHGVILEEFPGERAAKARELAQIKVAKKLAA